MDFQSDATKRKHPFSLSSDKATVHNRRLEANVIKFFDHTMGFMRSAAIYVDEQLKSEEASAAEMAEKRDYLFFEVLKMKREGIRRRLCSQSGDGGFYDSGVMEKVEERYGVGEKKDNSIDVNVQQNGKDPSHQLQTQYKYVYLNNAMDLSLRQKSSTNMKVK